MKIILNNRTEVFDKNNMSISEIMEIKNFSYQKIIVKLNNIIIKRNNRFFFILITLFKYLVSSLASSITTGLEQNS